MGDSGLPPEEPDIGSGANVGQGIWGKVALNRLQRPELAGPVEGF